MPEPVIERRPASGIDPLCLGAETVEPAIAHRRRANDIGEHNRQRDLLAAGSILETLRAGLTFGRQDERIENPTPVGGLVHRLDFRPEVNPLLRLGQ